MALVQQGNPTLLRTIATGAADDPDWPTLGTLPGAGTTFQHPGGTLHLFFVLVNATPVVIARGSALFTFELMRVVNTDINFVNNGTAVDSITTQIDYLEEFAVPGEYVVRVTGKSGMSGAVNLLIYGQAIVQ